MSNPNDAMKEKLLKKSTPSTPSTSAAESASTATTATNKAAAASATNPTIATSVSTTKKSKKGKTAENDSIPDDSAADAADDIDMPVGGDQTVAIDTDLTEAITADTVEADEQERNRIFKQVMEEQQIQKLKCCDDPVIISQLALHSPVAIPIVSAGATYMFFRQILRLWPELYAQALRYFTIPSAGMGILGFEVARRGLGAAANPFPQMALMTGIEATAGTFRYTLGTTIEGYCRFNSHETTITFPNNGNRANNNTGIDCSLSDAVFIGAMVIPNAMLFLLAYIYFYLKPAEWRHHHSQQSRNKWLLIHGLDLLFKSVLYGGILNALIDMTITIPRDLRFWVSLGTLVPGVGIASAIKARPKLDRAINIGFIYVMFGGISYFLGDIIKLELTRSQYADEPDSGSFFWGLAKAILLGGLAVVGVGYTIKSSARYVIERKQIAKFVSICQDDRLVVADRDKLLQVVDATQNKLEEQIQTTLTKAERRIERTHQRTLATRTTAMEKELKENKEKVEKASQLAIDAKTEELQKKFRELLAKYEKEHKEAMAAIATSASTSAAASAATSTATNVAGGSNDSSYVAMSDTSTLARSTNMRSGKSASGGSGGAGPSHAGQTTEIAAYSLLPSKSSTVVSISSAASSAFSAVVSTSRATSASSAPSAIVSISPIVSASSGAASTSSNVASKPSALASTSSNAASNASAVIFSSLASTTTASTAAISSPKSATASASISSNNPDLLSYYAASSGKQSSGKQTGGAGAGAGGVTTGDKSYIALSDHAVSINDSSRGKKEKEGCVVM